MEKYYTAQQLEILRLNQHLRENMTDDEILQLGADLESEEDLDENSCTPETLRSLRSDDGY
ncbi:hypothetical protein ABIB62_002353 [Mucilaginibacter sp. UYP25]|uniref:hypothetical protein n=1 Tax=unclassified Mucilaginibacter TaxID=2617802 RepID=UPI003391F1A5